VGPWPVFAYSPVLAQNTRSAEERKPSTI